MKKARNPLDTKLSMEQNLSAAAQLIIKTTNNKPSSLLGFFNEAGTWLDDYFKYPKEVKSSKFFIWVFTEQVIIPWIDNSNNAETTLQKGLESLLNIIEEKDLSIFLSTLVMAFGGDLEHSTPNYKQFSQYFEYFSLLSAISPFLVAGIELQEKEIENKYSL